MMIVIVFLILVCFIDYKLLKKHTNLLTAFNVYWISVCLMRLLTYGFSDSILYVILGCFSFSLGYIVINNNRKRRNPLRKKFEIIQNGNKRTKLIIIYYIILCGFNISLAYASYLLYLEGFSWNQIRGIFLTGSETSPPILTYAKVIFATPGTYLAGVVFSLELLSPSKDIRKIILMFLTTLCVIAYGFASQSRFIFFYYIVCILIVYVDGLKIGVLQRKSKIIKTILYTSLILIIGITIYRGFENNVGSPANSITEGLIGYALIPFYLMDYYFPIINQSDVWGYGTIFWGGFIDIVQNILKILNVGDVDILANQNEIIDIMNSEAVNIGNNKQANAFVSIFTYFYLDCRSLGIIIGCVLYGFYCGIIERIKYKSFLLYTIYLYSWIILAMTPVRWGLQMLSATVGIVYLIFFYGKLPHIRINNVYSQKK